MLRAACCLGFFGFLRAGEFTTSQPFDPSIHLTASDVQVDTLVIPPVLRYASSALKQTSFEWVATSVWAVAEAVLLSGSHL